jgi:hypothetical protein
VANRLSDPGSNSGSQANFCFDKPVWFVPKAVSQYDAWMCSRPKDAPAWVPAPCWLFKDKQTNEIFIYACQL